MNVAVIKSELHQKIEDADTNQLKELYGLVINYLNNGGITDDWHALSAQEKEEILQSSAQADQQSGKPLQEVVSKLRSKYGIND